MICEVLKALLQWHNLSMALHISTNTPFIEHYLLTSNILTSLLTNLKKYVHAVFNSVSLKTCLWHYI
jgi:hypothetical protein